MFRVVKAVLRAKDGVMSAAVTLSGTGYVKLYPGTAAEAEQNEAGAVSYSGKSDASGEGYYFEVPVSALDRDLPFAAFSQKNQAWYDRTIRFSSEGIPTHTKKTDEPVTPAPSPAPTPTSAPAKTDGKTAARDTSTTLADGTYTPDWFDFSGGTGKLQITCQKITVRDGKAYAMLGFDSSHVQYVKAAGGKYDISGQRSEIPVSLNENQTILVLTTAMSQPHEVSYRIYVGLAEPGSKAAQAETAEVGVISVRTTVGDQYEHVDEKAPMIAGLSYEGETKTEKAKGLAVYRYTDGQKNAYTLIETDLVKGTARDPELLTDEQKAELAKAAEEKEKPKTLDEQKAALYENPVIKYLVVPEGIEVPVGLDRLAVIISLPGDRIYVSDAAHISLLQELKAAEQIAAVGVEAEEIPDETLREAFEKGELVYGGPFDNPDPKALIRAKANLALESGAILPKTWEEIPVFTEKMKKIANRAVQMEMPVLFLRDQEAEDPEEAAEWILAAGAACGREQEAQALYEQRLAEHKKEKLG